MSTAARIWGAALPAVLLLLYVATAFCAYRVRLARQGRYHDEEAEERPGGALSGQSLRLFFTWLMDPWIAAVVRLRVPPNAVTSLSVFISAAAAIAVAVGRFSLGGWLYLVAALCDFVDGRLARRTGAATPAGALLDSVIDRCSEGAMLIGLAWFYRDRWVMLVVLAALTGSMLVPYVRAKGEALGTALAGVGFMQRPERVLLLGVTVALSPILEVLLAPTDRRPVHRLAVAGIVVLAVASHATAAIRTRHLFRALTSRTNATLPPTTAPRLRSVGAVSAGLAADFLVQHLLVDHLVAPRSLASAVGYVLGASAVLLLFGAGAWRSVPDRASVPAWWSFVIASGAILCAGGTAVLEFLPALGEFPTWLAVRVAVHLTWTRQLLGDRWIAIFVRSASHRA
jgi:phosphatidylglycerophosphate synthase